MKILQSFAVLFLFSTLSAQPSWKTDLKEKTDTKNPFGAIMTANLPTSTMLYSGDWHYEISHRFIPQIREKGAFGGLDGGANVRMSIGYGLRDNLNLRIGRSSFHDNVDIHLKFKILSHSYYKNSSAIALKIGFARNGDLPDARLKNRSWQYFAHLIYNVQWADSPLRIGIVPSILLNTAPYSVTNQHSIVAGMYALYYIDDMLGLWIETSPLIEGYRGRLWPLEAQNKKYTTPIALGASLETGGHVFYIFATNSLQLNPTQYLAGTPEKLSPMNWHIGFCITRHL